MFFLSPWPLVMSSGRWLIKRRINFTNLQQNITEKAVLLWFWTFSQCLTGKKASSASGSSQKGLLHSWRHCMPSHPPCSGSASWWMLGHFLGWPRPGPSWCWLACTHGDSIASWSSGPSPWPGGSSGHLSSCCSAQCRTGSNPRCIK